MGIETILGMIPKGGRYAKSVVNFVHKAPKSWPEFKSAIQQITDFLKIGRLRLDGKQKTIFETNKNILKNHEKVTKKVEVPPSVKKEFPPFNVSKEDFTKGWTPTLIERSKARNIYKKLEPPASKYTKEMEKIDEELDALAFGSSKYEHLSVAAKNKIMKKLQAEMNELIKKAMNEDLSKLSLSQINKRTQNIQKRIQEIIDNPNIKGTVTEGPKRDMIKAIADSERKGLENARNIIKRRNAEKKYGTTFPRLDPENDAFIITGLTESGNPMRVGRFTGRFSAVKDSKTGELTRKEGTSYWDKWDAKKNQIRKPNEEMWHETVDAEGKTIMSNPDYKVTTKNMDIWNEIYSDLSTSDLAKKGYKLKQIDMLVKGRAVNKYLEANKLQGDSTKISDIMEDLYLRGDDVYRMSIKEWTKKIPEYFAEGGRTGFRNPGLVTKGIELAKKFNLKTKAQTGGIFAALIAAMEAGVTGIEEIAKMLGKDDPEIYKPSDFYRLWKKYKAQKELLRRYEVFKTRGGPEMHEDYKSGYYKEQMPKLYSEKEYGEPKDYVFPTEKRNEHATGGVSNLFRERQGYRSGKTVIDLVKGARWLIKQLKSVLDDMIYGSANTKSIFYKMPEAEKVKVFKETEAAIKHLEAGGEIPENLLKTMRQDKRFQNLTVSKTGDKDFIEMQKVVLESKFPKDMREFMGKPLKTEDFVKIDLMAFKKTLPSELIAKLNKLPVENQTVLLKQFKEAFDATKTGGVEGGINVLEKQLLEDFIPKGRPHATGGLIDGYATGGVSNLFRSR